MNLFPLTTKIFSYVISTLNGLVGLNSASYEVKIPLIKALTIGCRPVQLLARYLQRRVLHGQEQQGGPNVPQHGD